MAVTRVSQSRDVKRRNRRWFRQRSITRGTPDRPINVTPGTPGTFDPPYPPYNLAELRDLGALGETATWTTGQRVVLDNGTLAHWDGNSWEAGQKP